MRDRDRLARSTQRPSIRVGLFGHIGACNIGNDASMEAVLCHVRSACPNAIVDAMCPGPQTVMRQYGIDAIPMLWYQRHERHGSRAAAAALKIIGKAIDVVRTARWVRRHEVVIVPGAGVLEASLPLWPWGMPYAMFVLSACGKLFGTRVALVSVGAGTINKRATRWLSNSAARLAFYRSYRDAGARQAMQQRGLDTTHDRVFTDLAFALPVSHHTAGRLPRDPGVVGLGVMAYHGSNDERRQAGQIYSAYVTAMKSFVEWLTDNGRTVRLFVGDTNGSDDSVAGEILAALRESRPELRSRAAVEPVTTFADVMAGMDNCGSIVAIRYHNLIAALKLAIPTISISYSPKHDVLMDRMGLGQFCLPVNTLDAAELIRLFRKLEACSGDLTETLGRLNAAQDQVIQSQLNELTAVLLAPGATGPQGASGWPARSWAGGYPQ